MEKKELSFVCKMDKDVLNAFRYFCKMHDMKVNEFLEAYVKEVLSKQKIRIKKEEE